MVAQMTVKSGKGKRDGVVSELTTIFTVKPGHTEELRAACERFQTALQTVDPMKHEQAGLREWRQVLIDGGQRLILMTSFETDWDVYIDDAALLLGVDLFKDWMQHTVEAEANAEGLAVTVRAARQGVAETAALKAVLQSAQVPACAYFDTFSAVTIPQVKRAQRVESAFQRVLDNPDAAEALGHPALKPLLDEAAE